MIIETIFKWQTFLWAMIWASSPFILWWVSWIIIKRRENKEKLYYLERVLVYHINDLLSNRKTILKFIEWNLTATINDVKNLDDSSYSLHTTFLPLFSTISINSEILKINTNSTYLDNKISHIYNLSQDIPKIIEDSRKQFESTIENNKIYVLSKISNPKELREMYIINLENFKINLLDNLIWKNLSIYLKVLVQTHEALKYFRELWYLKWNIKFHPKFKFFKNKKLYYESLEYTYNNIEEDLKDRTDKILNSIFL